VKMSKLAKKVLLYLNGRGFCSVREILEHVAPERIEDGRISDSAIYRTIKQLYNENYIYHRTIYGGYALTDKGAEKAVELKTEIENFILEWGKFIN